MLTNCVKCRNITENLNTKIFKVKDSKLLIQSKCAEYGIKKSRFVKELEAKGLLSNLGIKTPLSKIPLLNVFFECIKMNEIVNKFLLAGDTFMPEMQLKQSGFTTMLLLSVSIFHNNIPTWTKSINEV